MEHATLHTATTPVDTFVEAYRLAGNQLFTDCLEGINNGGYIEKAAQAAVILNKLDVPISHEAWIGLFMLKIDFDVAEGRGYKENDLEAIRKQKREAARYVLQAYGMSGLEVDDDLVKSAAKEGGFADAGLAMVLKAHTDYPELVSDRYSYRQDGQENKMDKAEALRYKINGRHAIGRHVGESRWNGFMLGVYKKKLAKLEA